MTTSPANEPAGKSDARSPLPDAEIQEYFQMLLSRLPWPAKGSPVAVRTLGVTSCSRGEGVSTVSAQLAVAAASLGEYRVLLVDANVVHPSVHRTFAVRVGPGLAEVLASGDPDAPGVQPTPVENLAVLPAGTPEDGGARIYDSKGLPRLVKALQEEFDLVIYDLPAAGQNGSAVRLAGLLDGIVLVIEAENVSWEVAQSTKDELMRADVRLLGVVMNKRREYVPRWLSQRV